MKKIHKILLMAVVITVLVVVIVLPSGVALADKTCHTSKAPLYSVNEDYPLKDGFVISTHMNGPVYFEKKLFQLHGAEKDHQFFIYREFTENVTIHIPEGPTIVVPLAGTLLLSGNITTDKHGNGHITTCLSPSNEKLNEMKALGETLRIAFGIDIDPLALTLKNVIYDGLLVQDGGSGGVRAYESDELTTYIDFKWTP